MAEFENSNYLTTMSIQSTTIDCNILFRKIFYYNNSVFLTVPTAAIAYDVEGSTIYREFKINRKDVSGYNKLPDKTRQDLPY